MSDDYEPIELGIHVRPRPRKPRTAEARATDGHRARPAGADADATGERSGVAPRKPGDPV